MQLTFTHKKIKETNGSSRNNTNLSETVLLTLKMVLRLDVRDRNI